LNCAGEAFDHSIAQTKVEKAVLMSLPGTPTETLVEI
jgi:hypothetical protein